MLMKRKGFIKVASKDLWQSGTPSTSGDFIVAILYPNGMGTITTARYCLGLGWDLDDNIVAYISVRNIMDILNISFPDDLVEP